MLENVRTSPDTDQKPTRYRRWQQRKRKRALIEQLITELAREPTPFEHVTISNLAAMLVRLDQLHAAESTDLDSVVRLTNASQRLWAALQAKREQPSGPSLRAYLAERSERGRTRSSTNLTEAHE